MRTKEKKRKKKKKKINLACAHSSLARHNNGNDNDDSCASVIATCPNAKKRTIQSLRNYSKKRSCCAFAFAVDILPFSFPSAAICHMFLFALLCSGAVSLSSPLIAALRPSI